MNEMINEIIDFENNRNLTDLKKNTVNNDTLNHTKRMHQFKEVFEPFIKNGKIEIDNDPQQTKPSKKYE